MNAFLTLFSQLAELAEQADLDDNARAELSMKQMVAAAFKNDRDGIDSAYNNGLQRAEGNPGLRRILKYNRALALYNIGAYDSIIQETLELIGEYYDHLGIDIDDVLFANVGDILAATPDTPDREDNLRHVGDCLTLLARAQQGGRPAHGTGSRKVAIAYMHSMKFYQAALAWRSAVTAGQDAVDELIAIGDLQGARQICEGLLLPAVTGYQMSDLVVPVRSQYAVVLAWCGESEAAVDEITRLEAYRVTDMGAKELANQRMLIERIIAERTGLRGNGS